MKPFLPGLRPWFRVLRRAGFVHSGPVFLPIAILFLTACGAGGKVSSPTPPAPATAPTIITQPTAQSTPLGQTATFAVVASGTAPFQYQWSKNGTPIGGATNSSFTTPDVVAADSGSSFTVTVSNNVGSVTSNTAVLSVGPRTPQAGDWRFQGMDLPAGILAIVTNVNGFGSDIFFNALGSPLVVYLAPDFNCVRGVSGDCSWLFSVNNAPSGATWPTTSYQADVLSNLDSDLNALAASNIVITSLDLEPANQIFAVSWLQTAAPGGFQYASQTVSPDQIQTAATQQGSSGHVITALSFDASGNAFIISYGWQTDTSTVYEASVVSTTSTDSGTITAEMTTLASQGYIITAMSRNLTTGIVIVGTRVQGDSLPRPIVVFTESGNQGAVSSALQSMVGNTQTITAFAEFAEQ